MAASMRITNSGEVCYTAVVVLKGLTISAVEFATSVGIHGANCMAVTLKFCN